MKQFIMCHLEEYVSNWRSSRGPLWPWGLTSPSVDCRWSSFLQVALKSPAAALTWTPRGASMIKDLVGDSSLRVEQKTPS